MRKLLSLVLTFCLVLSAVLVPTTVFAEGVSDPYGYVAEHTETINSLAEVRTDGSVNYIFIADLHEGAYNAGVQRQLEEIVSIANDSANGIDFVVLGGDLSTGMEPNIDTFKSKLNNLLAPMANCQVPVMILRGNHDDNSYYSIFTESIAAEDKAAVLAETVVDSDMWYDWMLATWAKNTDGRVHNGKSAYYYYDLADKNTRVICLDSIDYGTPSLSANGVDSWAYSDAQLQWLANEALGNLPAGYNVTVLSHMGYGKVVDRTSRNNTNAASLDRLENIMLAFNSKSTYSDAVVSCDYTGATGSIMSYQHGHSHYDLAFFDKALNIASINTTTAGKLNTTPTNNSNFFHNGMEAVNESRTAETVTEAAFDVVSVNSADGVVSKIRFGAGDDATFTLSDAPVAKTVAELDWSKFYATPANPWYTGGTLSSGWDSNYLTAGGFTYIHVSAGTELYIDEQYADQLKYRVWAFDENGTYRPDYMEIAGVYIIKDEAGNPNPNWKESGTIVFGEDCWILLAVQLSSGDKVFSNGKNGMWYGATGDVNSNGEPIYAINSNLIKEYFGKLQFTAYEDSQPYFTKHILTKVEATEVTELKDGNIAHLKRVSPTTVMGVERPGTYYAVDDIAGSVALSAEDIIIKSNSNKKPVWSGDAATEYAGGTGTEADPYLIETAEQLSLAVTSGGVVLGTSTPAYIKIADGVDEIYLNDIEGMSYAEAMAYLETDFDTLWNSGSVAFVGNFDGNGCTVYGMRQGGWPTNFFGGLTEGAVIKNFNIKYAFLRGGGAILAANTFAGNGNPIVISNCALIENSIDAQGGYIFSANGQKIEMTNCLFVNGYSQNANLSAFVNATYNQVKITNSLAVGVPAVNAKATNPTAWYYSLTKVYTDTAGGATAPAQTLVDNSSIKGTTAATTLAELGFPSSWVTTDSYPMPFQKPNGVVGGVWSGNSAVSFAGGYGTAESPYLIATGEQLHKAISSGGQGLYYKLTANILLNDVSDFTNWTNTSNLNRWFSSTQFTGVFDGDGYTVFGLYCNTPWNSWQYMGLFPMVGNGTVIKNLHVRNAYLFSDFKQTYAGVITGGVWDGGVSAEISGCSVAESSVILRDTNGGGSASSSAAGGLVGNLQFSANINNCYTGIGMTLESTGNAGAICGILWAGGGTRTITNCYTMYQNPSSCAPTEAVVQNVYKIVNDESQTVAATASTWGAVTTLSFTDSDLWYQADTTKGLPLLKSYAKHFRYGDIDGNGIDDEFTANCLVIVKKALLGIESFKHALIDVNNDGKSDIIDFIFVKKNF